MLWEKPLAIVLCIYGGLSHFGSIIGIVVPNVITGFSEVSAYHIPLLAAWLIRDVLAVYVAYLSIRNIPRAVKLLPILIVLEIVGGLLWMRSDSSGLGYVPLVFGSVIYLSAFILLRRVVRKLELT